MHQSKDGDPNAGAVHAVSSEPKQWQWHHQITVMAPIAHCQRPREGTPASMLIYNKCLSLLERYYGMSDVINIQLTAPSRLKEHQCPVNKSVTASGARGEYSLDLLWGLSIVIPQKRSESCLQVKKNKQPRSLLFCQLLPGQLKKEKNLHSGHFGS